jgi:guanidinopropionase
MTGKTDDSKHDLPRYSGIPTFLRAPYSESIEDLDIALIGVPYDGGVTFRPGARHGPMEMRQQSALMRRYHGVTRQAPFDQVKVADIGDVPIEHHYSIEDTFDDITRFYEKLHAAGVVPLTAGGDHSITYPIFKAIAKDGPIGMVHIDAHTDTWDEFQGSKFNHGSPFRLACEDGLIDPKRCIQIGIRGPQNTFEGWDYSLKKGMRVVFMEEFAEIGVKAVIEEARKIVGDGPTYITFDVDGLDPVYAPGTGTPEIGGMTTIDALTLLRGLKGLNLIGGDVVEVAPPFDPTGNTSLVGVSLMYEIFCLLADKIAHQKTG